MRQLQPPRVQMFLLQTAVLRTLTPLLCTAVTGYEGELTYEFSADDFDEGDLLTTCRDHGILLIVNEALRSVAQEIFTTTGLDQWRSALAASTLHSLEMHRELQRLITFFDDADLPVVFCGVNWDAATYGYPFKNATGIVEVA